MVAFVRVAVRSGGRGRRWGSKSNAFEWRCRCGFRSLACCRSRQSRCTGCRGTTPEARAAERSAPSGRGHPEAGKDRSRRSEESRSEEKAGARCRRSVAASHRLPPPRSRPCLLPARSAGLVKVSPLAGSELPIAKIPRGVSTLNSNDIKREDNPIPQEFLNSRIPSVMIDDLQGNQFQTGIQYRGFEASPVNGLAAGPGGLPERNPHQRGLRRYGQLGLPADQCHSTASRSWDPIRYSD